MHEPITVHHLEDSRSQRILFLLEELGLEYEIRRYERDPETRLAPDSLRRVHPLGKAPVVSVGDEILAESGAILEELAERFAPDRLVPERGTAEHRRYRYWMHAAEGSLMPLLVLRLVFHRVATAPMPFFVRPVAKGIAAKVGASYVDPSLEAQLGFVEAHLETHPFFAGEAFTAADIQMSFPLEAAVHGGRADTGPRTRAWVETIHARPAYRRALERGGPYAYA